MKKRETPRRVDRPNVIHVQLPEGDHYFRIPSMLTVAKLLKGAGSRHLAALLSMGKLIQGGDTGGSLAMLQASGAEGLALMGALIGHSWYHETLNLEVRRADYGDEISYGEAVYEALHDEGYDTVKLMLLAGYLAKHVQESVTFDAEVAEKLGFSLNPTKEQKNS